MTTTPRTRRVTVGDWPRLTRFYGIGPTELQHVPQGILRHYLDCIPTLEVEEIFHGLLISDFPHYSERDRDFVVRRLERGAGIIAEPTLDVGSDAGKVALKGMGIGYKVSRV